MSIKLKIENYFFENISTVVWSAVLAIGGLVFLAYFTQIEYMPELDLSSSAAIFAAAAASAILIMLVLAGVFILSGAFWSSTNKGTALSALWIDKSGNYTNQGALLWFLAPILIAISSIISITKSHIIEGITIITASSISYGILAWRNLPAITIRTFTKAFLGFLISIVISAFILAFPLTLIFMMAASGSKNDLTTPWFSALLLSALVLAANLLVVIKPKTINPITWYAVIGFGVLIIVLIHFDRFSVVASRTLQIFKFGNITEASVVLNKDGCTAAEALELKAIEKKSEETCILRNAKILSRLGSELYIEGQNLNNSFIRLSIPSAFVVTWSIPINTEPRAGK